jgi:hypothetical protein
MPKPQQPPSMLIDMRTSFNLLNFVADVHTAAIRPFTRSGMGTRGLGAAGIWAGGLLLVYAGAANAPEMLRYAWVWLALVVYRRLTADRRQHSQFQGIVWMFDWLFTDEMKARLLEVVVVWIVGSYLCRFSEPLGQFVAWGALSFAFKYAVHAATRARQSEAAHNARVEMETMQRRFEEERQGR